MIISILGCGWYGRALASELIAQRIVVKGSATNAENLELLRLAGILPYLVKFDSSTQSYDPDFFRCDVMVIAIPPGFRKGHGEQYLSKIRRIMETVIANKITKAIYISSTGVYSDCNREVNENDIPEPDSDSGRILFAAEQLFRNESRVKTTIIRFGGLVGPGRNPAHFFTGKTGIPNGLAPVNLIHQSDCVGITNAVIEAGYFGGTINACTPDHIAKADFYCEMTRKAKLPLPVFVSELRNWKVVNSIHLAEKLKYKFIIKSWQDYPIDELI